MDWAEANQLDDATTLTVGELRAAVKAELPEQFDELDQDSADVIATDIIRAVMNSREPEWHIGDVVRDHNDVIWMRYTTSQWVRMAKPGVFSHLKPARPLTLIDSPHARGEEPAVLWAP